MNTIRKNPAILIVAIGLAMTGFILMDMLTPGGPGGSSDFVLGKVNGERIDWQVFNDTENRLYSNSSQDILGRREQLWNYFVDRILVNELSDGLGLGVGKAEMQELQFGTFLSPVIQRNFADPNTRMVDREQLNSVRQAIEANQMPDDLRTFWAEQEREIIKERLQAKASSLIAKAMYTPTWQAEVINQYRQERCDAEYVRIPFEVIPDSEVSFTDADLQQYLKENAYRFQQTEETRAVRYVRFPVFPSDADMEALAEGLRKLVPAFEESENDTLFVENNYGVLDAAYFTRDIFTNEEADALFDLPNGSVYGPFIENNQYVLVKVLDSKIIPDSVKSRHILIQAQDPMSRATAQATLDSLKGLIESRTVSFDTLAFQYGQDATRTSGGDLGFTAQGQMVKEYNDLIFFQAVPGKLYTVNTQFGVHLVEVTDRKFIENKKGIQMAMLLEPIIASDATQKRAYQKALELVSRYRTLSELEEAAKQAKDWSLESSNLFRENDYNLTQLGQGSAAREVIRWAFKQGSTGKVSPEVYTFEDAQTRLTNAYVVAALDRISPKGQPKLDNVRNEVEREVRQQAKGKKIAEQIAGMNNLEAIAGRYSLNVDNASAVSFGSSFVPGVGNEPRFVAIVTAMPVGSTTKPIIGKNGVYVARVTDKPGEISPANVAMIRQQNRAQRSGAMGLRFPQTMRNMAKITDNRSDFY